MRDLIGAVDGTITKIVIDKRIPCEGKNSTSNGGRATLERKDLNKDSWFKPPTSNQAKTVKEIFWQKHLTSCRANVDPGLKDLQR